MSEQVVTVCGKQFVRRPCERCGEKVLVQKAKSGIAVSMVLCDDCYGEVKRQKIQRAHRR